MAIFFSTHFAKNQHWSKWGTGLAIVMLAWSNMLYANPTPQSILVKKTEMSSLPQMHTNTPIAWQNTAQSHSPYHHVPDVVGQVGLLSRQHEQKVGEKVLRLARKSLPQVNDLWLQQEVENLFQQIYSQTHLGQPLAVMVVKDSQINAFAVPSGFFAINTGTIASAQRLDEVVGVIAHEVAHVSQRHYSRSQDANKLMNAWSWLGMLAGVALSSQSAELGSAVMLGSQAASLNSQLKYSRDQEREADRIGMQYLAMANYRPESMADFFEQMQRKTTQLSILPDFWLTHPLSQERMSEARLRARQYTFHIQQKDELQRQQLFELLRWRALFLSQDVNLQQLKVASEQHNIAASLALASYYIQQSQLKDARQILSTLKPNTIQQSLYHFIYTDLLMAEKGLSDALTYVLQQYQIRPENRALALKTAELYLLNQKFKEAEQILLPMSRKTPRDVWVWQLLQRIESHKVQGKNSTPEQRRVAEINSLRYHAEALFWRGEQQEAIKALQHAKRLDQAQPIYQQQISQRLQAMEEDKAL